MNKYIVVTTINPMTEAIKLFDKLEDWNLIVVGDKKTPSDYFDLENGCYMHCEMQESLYPELSRILGWNTVDRRNLGFLYAYQQGADVVAMVDDDNLPLGNWGKDIVLNQEIEVDYYETRPIAFDPLSVTNHSKLWHRGFPIELLQLRESKKIKKKITPLVQANLWNVDPDVDAICRMMYNPLVVFNTKNYYASNRFSPFNMQNTLVSRKALKYVISFPFTGRMCDIWGAYYFQSHYPESVVYGPATVEHVQDRSWESIVKDLTEEILGYKSTIQLLIALSEDPEAIFQFVDSKTVDFVKLYQSYFQE